MIVVNYPLHAGHALGYKLRKVITTVALAMLTFRAPSSTEVHRHYPQSPAPTQKTHGFLSFPWLWHALEVKGSEQPPSPELEPAKATQAHMIMIPAHLSQK